MFVGALTLSLHKFTPHYSPSLSIFILLYCHLSLCAHSLTLSFSLCLTLSLSCSLILTLQYSLLSCSPYISFSLFISNSRDSLLSSLPLSGVSPTLPFLFLSLFVTPSVPSGALSDLCCGVQTSLRDNALCDAFDQVQAGGPLKLSPNC